VVAGALLPAGAAVAGASVAVVVQQNKTSPNHTIVAVREELICITCVV
jgi:hypothetical protein